jgi:hypothetical protein
MCYDAGGTMETRHGFESISMENINIVLKGREPLSLVNLHLMSHQECEVFIDLLH